LNAGDKLDRYVLVGLLGMGGMSEVYRAKDERLLRHVALKVLRADKYGTSHDTVDRLLREARTAAAFTHPNVVAIHDVAEAQTPEAMAGTPYIAMEFIDGQSLRAFIGTDVPLAQRIRWLTDVARALSAAHRAGLVHRDVKPENVMVRADGVVKVLDFGITRKVDTPADAAGSATSSKTDDSWVSDGMGTPCYMAPEQLQCEPLDGRADQFAWGVMAYEVLSGSIPWRTRASSAQLVAEIVSRYPEPLMTRSPDVPLAVAAAVMRALAKSREHRFATMDDVVAALEGATTPVRPVSEPPDTTRTTGPTESFVGKTLSSAVPRARPPRTRRNTVIAAALVAAVVTIAIVSKVGVHPRAVTGPASASNAAPPQPPVNPEALALYAAGIQADRDGSAEIARANFEGATKIDPSFAAAHVRALSLAFQITTPDRDHFRSALLLRARLDEKERMLLDAYEPAFRGSPDLDETDRRLMAVAHRFPSDPFLLVLAARSRLRRGDPQTVVDACDEALAHDPDLASAWLFKATALIQLDRVDEANHAYGECLRVSPRATSCLRHLSELDANEGRCAEAEQLSRALISADPNEPRWFVHLARSIYSKSQSIEAARAALEQRWARTPPNVRAQTELEDEFYLDVLGGAFEKAEERALQWERAVFASMDERDHAFPALMRMLLHTELGQTAKVAQIAQDFVSRRGAWVSDDYLDYRIVAFAARYKAGAVPRAAYVRDRDAWLAEVEKKGIGTPALRWVTAHAEAVRTKEDALEALAQLPRDRPMEDAMHRDVESDDARGFVHLMAGNPEAAIPFLQRAARGCTATYNPFWHTSANLHLGMANEARGDVQGACEAYRVVIARWGGNARSVSARHAKARVEALRCSK
jgi:serine/threonine-protein kinase